MNDIRERLLRLVAEQLSIKPEDISDDATLELLGADSLDRVELIMKIEEEFELEINDDDAEKLTRFGQLVSYVEQLTSAHT